MVQTPLQLVVEQLFQRIQSQAAYLNQMKEKMERIAVKDVTADELLERIRLLESKQGEAAGPKLDPFNQQEILSRLEALENKLADQAAARSEWASSGEGMADVESRLARLESRLSGVYNLNGKLLALEQIAGGLGVAEVAEGLKKGGEPRDMDTLFHERLNGLEAALGDVRTELKGAMEERLEGAPTLEDLQALEEALEGRASADALRQLQLQTHALGQAVAGVSDALALRPELGDQLRECLAGELDCCGDGCCSSVAVSRALAEYCQHSDAAREAFVRARGFEAMQLLAAMQTCSSPGQPICGGRGGASSGSNDQLTARPAVPAAVAEAQFASPGVAKTNTLMAAAADGRSNGGLTGGRTAGAVCGGPPARLRPPAAQAYCNSMMVKRGKN
eukprot:XP_001702877.1 flagellar associated protein [Chlamydomonas reinhardtii]